MGGGFSGTCAAILLSRQGLRVAVVDLHADYPPDFRAEHLDGAQIDQLERLGLLAGLTAGVQRGDSVVCGRRGRTLGCWPTINYGLSYDRLVNMARAMLPPTVVRIFGKVIAASTNAARQQIHLADGRRLTARLLVIATGLSPGFARALGMRRVMLHKAHSLTFGFNLQPIGRPDFEHSFYVYEGESLAERIDYISVFRLGDETRANLFTFADHHGARAAAFRTCPTQALRDALPGLARVIGEYCVSGPVVARPMDLYVTEGYRQPGVVLIGDAFQTACPAAGAGIARALIDVERLCCVHIPQWLQANRTDRTMIEQFYDDPVKMSSDAKALHDSRYRRLHATQPGFSWALHRQQVHLRRRVHGWALRQKLALRTMRERVAAPSADAGDELASGEGVAAQR
ncbi:MAG: FAD-dependent monooxygenase [Proteobacteria bacterium]|nr:FAD-dependent monooxygenase [Pseudomonadota bacterium]